MEQQSMQRSVHYRHAEKRKYIKQERKRSSGIPPPNSRAGAAARHPYICCAFNALEQRQYGDPTEREAQRHAHGERQSRKRNVQSQQPPSTARTHAGGSTSNGIRQHAGAEGVANRVQVAGLTASPASARAGR